MTTHTMKPIRIVRNHYICDACPNEWSAEFLTVSADWCPCCDGPTEPYDSQELLEEVLVEEDVW